MNEASLFLYFNNIHTVTYCNDGVRHLIRDTILSGTRQIEKILTLYRLSVTLQCTRSLQ